MNFFRVSIIILSSFIYSCNDNHSINEINLSDASDYVWTIDTIYSNSLQTVLTTMWGQSPQDLWIAGYSSDNSKCIYHFDGEKFYSVSSPSMNAFKEFYAIDGINSDNILFVGTAHYYNPSPPPNFLDSGIVFQYSNGKWKLRNEVNLTPIYTICSINLNETWAGGADGMIIKISNTDIEKYFLENNRLLVNCIVSNALNEIYVSGHDEYAASNGGYTSADYLFKLNEIDWKLIDSNITSDNYNRSSYPVLMKNINGTIYGSGQMGFTKQNGDSWTVLRSDIFGQFDGTDEKNIFLASQDFGVYYYNGSDFYLINALPRLAYYDVEVFKGVVFILATDGLNSFLVIGRKKS